MSNFAVLRRNQENTFSEKHWHRKYEEWPTLSCKAILHAFLKYKNKNWGQRCQFRDVCQNFKFYLCQPPPPSDNKKVVCLKIYELFWILFQIYLAHKKTAPLELRIHLTQFQPINLVKTEGFKHFMLKIIPPQKLVPIKSCFHINRGAVFSSSEPKAQSILGWRGFKFIQIKGPALSSGETITKKNLFLQNNWANSNQT